MSGVLAGIIIATRSYKDLCFFFLLRIVETAYILYSQLSVQLNVPFATIGP